MNATTTDPAAVWQALASILDPEFGISIVDLGLIYSVEASEGKVHVVMTLTTETCPSGSWIHEGTKAALRQIPGVKEVEVDLVFEPPWNAAMLTPEARRHLGWPDGE
jgi:metal-sulfur cluster biosynthetic enzyme